MNPDDQCWACLKPFRSSKRYRVDTRDGQTVFVGPTCFKEIQKAGERGWQHKSMLENGPRLYLLK